jgi:hypothetical protein
MKITSVSKICNTEAQIFQYGYSGIMMIIICPYSSGVFLQIPQTLLSESVVVHPFVQDSTFGDTYRIRH